MQALLYEDYGLPKTYVTRIYKSEILGVIPVFGGFSGPPGI